MFHCDQTDVPMLLELPLRETIFSCLFFTFTSLPFLLTERGRSIYWRVCLLGTPVTLLWMHFLPPARFHSIQSDQ